MKGDSDLYAEIQLQKLPPRSMFYWLPPEGKDTPFVESLSSYGTRLSDGHRIAVSTLIMYDISPILSSNYFTPKKITFHSYTAANAINGIGHMADEWNKALQTLTKRDDLGCMTLLRFTNIFANNNLLRKTRAWCPACFNQQAEKLQENALPIYDMLLWTLQAVKVCTIHKIALQTLCPHCKKENLHIGPTALPGHCTGCQRWLGVEPTQALPTPDIEKQHWIALSIGEMLYLTQHEDLHPEKKGVRFALQKLIDLQAQGNRSSFAKEMGIPLYLLDGYLTMDTKFQLPVLMDICFATKTPLIQLLRPELDVNKFEKSVPNKIPKQHPISTIKSDKTRKIWKKREVIMELIVSGKKLPINLNKLSNEFGCHVSALYRRCPELCKAITKRNTGIHETELISQRKKLKLKILSIVDKIVGEGHYPSQKRVFKIAKVDWEPNREVLDEILQEKGIRKKTFKECHLYQCR